MQIRKAVPADLENILQIYAHAREQMKKNGNPTQWGDHRPALQVIEQDIALGNSYVLEENEQICGVFVLIMGPDPTYATIYQSSWLNDEPYGTIHRLASGGSKKGVFSACLKFCEQQIPNIRIDTHRDNLIMQHLLERAGYVRCGIIRVDDGTERIAYQRNTSPC